MIDQELFHFLERLSACNTIGGFVGDVYRMEPGGSTTYSWHTDTHNGNLRAISVNLSSRSYSGGVLQLRDKATGRRICEMSNTGYGDALVFRLSPTLQHRVPPVEGPNPKTAFAGWFHRKSNRDAIFERIGVGSRPDRRDRA